MPSAFRYLTRLGSLLLATLATACASAGAVPSALDAGIQEELSMKSPIAHRQSYWLEQLTWLEIRDAVSNGMSDIIVPTGGIEQNGPYLATGKHNLILEVTCPEIARQLGSALCAPIVPFVPQGDISPPTGLMRFPGTISVSDQTFEHLLTDIGRSLKQAGFTNIIFIGDSGGNQAGMSRVAKSLNHQWKDLPTRALYIKEFYDPGWVATERYSETDLGISQTRNDGYHDDIWVTAMMMVRDPDAVRLEERKAAGLAHINGVPIIPLGRLQDLGRKMIQFRAHLTAKAIRQALRAD